MKSKLLLVCTAACVINFVTFCSNGQSSEKGYKIEKDFINHSAMLSYGGEAEAESIECSFESKFCKDGEVNVDGDRYLKGKKIEIYNNSSKVEIPVLVSCSKNMDPEVSTAISKLTNERTEFPVSSYMLGKYRKSFIPTNIESDTLEITMSCYISDFNEDEYSFEQAETVLVLAKVFRVAHSTQQEFADLSHEELKSKGEAGIKGASSNHLAKSALTALGERWLNKLNGRAPGEAHSCPFAKVNSSGCCFNGQYCKTMNKGSWVENLGVFEMRTEDYKKLATFSPVAIYNYECNKFEIIDESDLQYMTEGFKNVMKG